MLRGPSRALLPVFAAALLSIVPATPAAGIDGGLLVMVDARYRAIPAETRVHVTLDAVATSLEPDTAEGQVYYSGLTFVVPAGATNIVARSGGARLGVAVVEDTADYRAVEVTFSRGVFYQQSYAYTVDFDLVDRGGAGNRDVRVGRSVVAFPVWAYGTDGEPGSSVRVELPDGYQPTVQGSEMEVSDGPSGPVLTARPSDPVAFFAYVSADLPGAFTQLPLEVTLADEPARVTIRAWEDDAEWGDRMVDVLSRGLPALESAIGVPYPHVGRLSVEEAAISRLGEYAGLYDPNEAVIRIRYDADATVALHEAAHVWFNDRLLHGRWINEAWAEYYAVTVGATIGAPGETFELTADLLEVRIPLNDWGAVGREDLAVEDFAYAATYELALEIAARTDADGLQRVWQAAAARELAYVPPGSAPSEGRARLGQPGWQRLLDLLEERTGASYADLWAEWVVNREEHPMLALRASARTQYAAVLDEAEDWQLPAEIRTSLDAWDFDEARADLRAAERILADRDRIRSRAAVLGLQPSDRMQIAFEGDDGLRAGAAAAKVELATLAELADAQERLGTEPGLIEAIGLLGMDPTRLLDAARDDYQAGELGAARRAAVDAVAERDAAAATGASRATLAGGLLLALDGMALSLLSARRLRRRPATLFAP